MGEEGFTKSNDSGFHGGSYAQVRNEENPPTTPLEEVFSGKVSRAPVVDTNQVIVTTLGKRQDAAIQQDDRNLRLVERRDDRHVRLVFFWREFQRGKKHTGNVSFNELTAKAERLLFLGGTGRIRASPEQAMLGCPR